MQLAILLSPAAAGPTPYECRYSTVATPRVTAEPVAAASLGQGRATVDGQVSSPAPAPAGMVAVPAAVPYFSYVATANEDQSIDMQCVAGAAAGAAAGVVLGEY